MKFYLAITVLIVILQEGVAIDCDSILSWRCSNGDCIHFNKLCNGAVDCADGSDETMLECFAFRCSNTQFQCAYGACVHKDAKCNGVKDCVDNSDELAGKCVPNHKESLRGGCAGEQVQCKSGQCIPADSLCDGTPQCFDKSDESLEFCASSCCPPFGFRCSYGGCIDPERRCDGKIDCADGSDEHYKLCGYPSQNYITNSSNPELSVATSTVPSDIPTADNNNNDIYPSFVEVVQQIDRLVNTLNQLKRSLQTELVSRNISGSHS